jgi:hypothetical protein
VAVFIGLAVVFLFFFSGDPAPVLPNADLSASGSSITDALARWSIAPNRFAAAGTKGVTREFARVRGWVPASARRSRSRRAGEGDVVFRLDSIARHLHRLYCPFFVLLPTSEHPLQRVTRVSGFRPSHKIEIS